MDRVDEIRGRIPPEVEEKLDRAVKTFRENHRHPANLAMHAVGYINILRGVFRILRGRLVPGFVLIAMGVGLIVAGHRLEGTEPFAILKDRASGNGSRK